MYSIDRSQGNSSKDKSSQDKSDEGIWYHGNLIIIISLIIAAFILGLALPIQVPAYYLVALCLGINLILSFIIAQQYIQQADSLISKLCYQNSYSDCKAILDNPKAKFFNIPYADIGIIYFAGSLLLLIISKSLPWLVSIMSILAVGYSFYSLVCQKVIIKKWCSLCLLTLCFIIIQASIVAANYKSLSFAPSSDDLPLLLSFAVFIFTSLLWLGIRFFLVSKNGNQALNKEAKKSLLSKATIKQIRKHKQLADQENNFEELEGDIVFHKKFDANTTNNSYNSKPWHVVIGIAPSCAHCGDFLEQLLTLIEQENLPIKVRIRFVVFNGDDQDGINDKVVSENTIALAVSEGSEVALAALRSWYQTYSDDNLTGWEANLRNFSDEEINMTGIFIAENSFWLQDNDITETPTLYIENYKVEPGQITYVQQLLRKLCEY